MPTSMATIKSLKLGDLSISDFKAVLLDLKHVNETYASMGHPTIDGVIGNDILTDYKAVINYRTLELSLKLKAVENN